MIILLIAVGLAMDSFTVAISGGASKQTFKINEALLIAVYFGFFQSLMTFLGWYSGVFFNKLIESFDHWIVFSLLVFIGGKMLWESQNHEDNKSFAIKHKVLIMLAIATSLDALGTGVSFAFLNQKILLPVIIIGVVAFIFSFLGFYLGKILHKIIKQKAEILGGIILIGIACKILFTHLS